MALSSSKMIRPSPSCQTTHPILRMPPPSLRSLKKTKNTPNHPSQSLLLKPLSQRSQPSPKPPLKKKLQKNNSNKPPPPLPRSQKLKLKRKELLRKRPKRKNRNKLARSPSRRRTTLLKKARTGCSRKKRRQPSP